MELAVVDTFVRSDTLKGGSRAGDAPAVSFSDVLDASTHRPEPTPRSRDNARDDDMPKAAATPSARADETRSTKAEDAKPETPRAPARAKAKSEVAAEDASADPSTDTAASTESDDAETPAAAPTPETADAPERKGKGAAALDLIAALLASGDANVDPAVPKGQLVAAIIVPQNVPEHAAAAGNHTVPGLVTAPAPTQPTVPEPTTAASVPTGGDPATVPATPTGFTPTQNVAAPAPQPISNTQPTADAPELVVAPAAVPVEGATATPTVPAPAPAPLTVQTSTVNTPTTPTAPAPDALPVDALVAELADDIDGPAPDLAVTEDTAVPLAGTAASSSTSVRPTTGQAPSSGYVAQMVSQEAASSDTPEASAAPLPEDRLAVAQRNVEAALAEAPAPSDDVVAAKPAETLAIAAADASSTRETHAAESTTASRNTRPVAIPVPEQVVVRIAKAVADGVDRINVKLSPAELGHIDVRMEIGPDGRFQAVFAADRPQTVELLQRDARELARALQDAGLRADTGSLSFNLRGQGGQQGNADSAPSRTGSLPLAAGGEELPGEAATLPVYRAAGHGNGRVDIRV